MKKIKVFDVKKNGNWEPDVVAYAFMNDTGDDKLHTLTYQVDYDKDTQKYMTTVVFEGATLLGGQYLDDDHYVTNCRCKGKELSRLLYRTRKEMYSVLYRMLSEQQRENEKQYWQRALKDIEKKVKDYIEGKPAQKICRYLEQS